MIGSMRSRSIKRLLLKTVGSLRRLRRSEKGAAYSLNMAITLPFYTVLVGFLIEWSLMQNVHVGVNYAAWAAARAAIVWIPAEATNLTTAAENTDMVRRAAVNAITPWSSSIAPPASGAVDSDGSNAMLVGYQSAALGTQQQASYVQKKWNYANSATRVEFDPPLEELRSSASTQAQVIRVTVHYEMPFNLPGIGRLIGRHNGKCWVRDLQATVELKIERPATATGQLGFSYDSRPFKKP